MKTTMKNHGNLYKIKRVVRKITMNLILASLVLAFAACEKEEIFEPDQEVHEVDEAVKGIAQIGPRLSLEIRQVTHNAAYVGGRNITVKFKGRFLSVGSGLLSSPNASDWTLERKSLFPTDVRVEEAVVHNGKIWAIAYSSTSRAYRIYSSGDGYSWRLATSSLPFSLLTHSGAVVFNNKIFVFAWRDYSASAQSVYSSSDGINWVLENDNAFRARLTGTPIVFKDALYYIGGLNNGAENQNTIFKSTNGRDWSQVSGATPTYLNPTEDFPAKSHHAAVVHDNKVWVTGGEDTVSRVPDDGKEIWYSGDMKNWTKYTGYVSFKSLNYATMVSYNDKIILFGGRYYVGTAGSLRSVSSKYIWSIKPKIKYTAPGVEIPREHPPIPRF